MIFGGRDSLYCFVPAGSQVGIERWRRNPDHEFVGFVIDVLRLAVGSDAAPQAIY